MTGKKIQQNPPTDWQQSLLCPSMESRPSEKRACLGVLGRSPEIEKRLFAEASAVAATRCMERVV